MAKDHFQPKLGRIRDAQGRANLSTRAKVFRQAGKAGARAVRLRSHVLPSSLKRGMGTGALAAAGLIAPGSRRVVVKARYTRQRPGDLGAAKAHLRYIQRDGVTRDGIPGHAYDASSDDTDLDAFLDRSDGDPHQFRFIVSPEDSARLPDLKPFIRDLMSHMEQDLGTKLDWVAVDHFNTGHPHSHVVIRGKDDRGEDLIIARDYIGHGVRARAQALVTLELGPETEIERSVKLVNEVEQERFTYIDRTLLGRTKDGIVVVTSADQQHPVRQTMRIGRLKKLEQLGLAEERRAGVWSLDTKLEPKLRQLGERADTFKMMQRALKQAGIERPGPGLAVFESGRRRSPVIAKVVAVGLVDEITDRQYVIVDGTDGRVHYAELGRLSPAEVPARGMIVSLTGDSLQGKPKPTPRLQVLSPVELASQIDYDGPTWLDRALIARQRVHAAAPGFGAELHQALRERSRWLAQQKLADIGADGDMRPNAQMLTLLRQRETAHLAQSVSRQLNAMHMPHEPGSRISGVYERSISTPTGILLNLSGLAERTHQDREIVDLLFFPTGGGKTEAYLGLAAFTIAHRRLSGSGVLGAGVSVIMRYTLRLLTLDQLSRAAGVICALELMRNNPAFADESGRKHLGDWPIEIGLWVGSDASPNKLGGRGNTGDDTAVTRVRRYKSGRGRAPAPLKACPWCGTEFGTSSFECVPNTQAPTNLEIRCVNSACDFTRGRALPILTVDEPIYRRLPAFLIATVDKFAALPWIGESGAFFGNVDRFDPDVGFFGASETGGQPLDNGWKLDPPDLIIQDELHLISGPLGTVAGLYETAIDRLSTRTYGGKRIRPKIVASTATVRRADTQIKALFDRHETQIFPPPGVNRTDSFFAKTVRSSENAARYYLGLAAQGRGPKLVFLRGLTTLLAAAQAEFEQEPPKDGKSSPADPYVTALCYFNALRELGGARRIVEDEVRDRVSRYGHERRRLLPRDEPFKDRKIPSLIELTSRVSTDDVALAKKQLEGEFGLSEHKVDVALATNMISVGLDITRLGLMVVQGQPKTAAEYIQATSRVGRNHNRPGLVVTILNLHKPRDRTHFEQFCQFHRTFYRAVEATSVTPWAATRVASSHIRVGTFQFFAARADVDAIRHLADHVIARHYPEAVDAANPYRALLEQIIGRQADLIAQWLLVGFIHGVMNTDNMSIAGETIDYGPCAFMDSYDHATVYSSIDSFGRYAYGNQPRVAQWNLARLAEALLPLLDEDKDTAMQTANEALDGFSPRFETAYTEGLRRKFGLLQAQHEDLSLAQGLLERMAQNGADFTLTFRRLCEAAAGPDGDAGVRSLFADPTAYDGWAEQWRRRLADDGIVAPLERMSVMRAANPAVIPRNHLVEEAISAAVNDSDFGPFESLLAVLARPYDDLPSTFTRYADPPRPEQVVRQTFCGT